MRASLVVGPNVNITGENAPDRQQVEPTVAVDPRNPNIIVAGAQDLRLKERGGHRWLGYYRSTDGGLTWSSNLIPGFPGDISLEGRASPLHHFNASSDPVLTFDRLGNVYCAGLVLNITGSPGTIVFSSVRTFVARYNNDGRDFVGAAIIGGGSSDKPWIAVDTSGGRNDGNVYVAFDSPGTVFVRSTDRGKTFSKPDPVPAGGLLPGVAVDNDGNVFVSSIHFSGNSGAQVLVTKSADGGLSFERTVVVARIIPIPSPLPGNGFRTTTIPQIAADAKGVYVVYDDFGTGQANVFFSRSTDGGLTCSSPLRINDETIGQHFFPTIAVSGGNIGIAWYDSRLGQLSNGTIVGLDVFYSQSRDNGRHFLPNGRVTTVSFNPNLVKRTDPGGANRPFMGDYIQAAASPSAIHVIWADNRNACDTVDPAFGCVDQDAFTATITF